MSLKKKQQKLEFCKLLSKQGKKIGDTPWQEYPRPMMKRNSYVCLNGKWDFSVKGKCGDALWHSDIVVPFSPESVLSGVDKVFPEEATLLYKRTFSLPVGFKKDRVLLHFGAVDQIARVYVNGKLMMEHVGGYSPFFVDITDALQEENELVVEVEDHLSNFVLPYGKQCQKRGGMWYTPVSGIWQTVWMESVSKEYIQNVTATLVGSVVEFSVQGVDNATIRISTPDGEIKETLQGGKVRVSLENPTLWTPENPYLYHYSVETAEDRVESYFAVRTLSIEEVQGIKRLCLNGKPYFFHGLLDQGYFSDGIFTPATPDVYTEEIERIKALGFNTLRKHIKIEPQIFYAECDRLGVVVWQDMVNNGDYKYIRDTVLPTVGFIWKMDKWIHRNKEMRKVFLQSMKETVELLKCHPCICLWTIFNEGWGQFESEKAYETLREIDKTRFIDATSGWFRSGDAELDSRHIYFRKVQVKPTKKPIIISEFGGYTYLVEGHAFNPAKTYGYGACQTREEFVAKIRLLYESEVLPAAKNGACASIYTQVSDVEDEINGLFTYDREVAKITPQEFADISIALQKAVENT